MNSDFLRQVSGNFLLLFLCACAPSAFELKLLFPNEEAKLATDEIEVFVFTQDGSNGRTDVRCSERLGRLEQGKSLGAEPFARALSPPFAGQEIESFPSGNPVIFVVGYRRIDAERRFEFLEGCTESFDTDNSKEDVILKLNLIKPADVFLEKAGGDLQVSLLGQVVAIPIKVRAKARYQSSSQQNIFYPLPGLELLVSTSQGVVLVDAPDQSELTIATDGKGYASLNVRVEEFGDFDVIFDGNPLVEDTVMFKVSALEGIAYENRISTYEHSLGVSNIIELKIGEVTGRAPARDIVVLSCDGTIEACGLGSSSTVAPGQTTVSVLRDPKENTPSEYRALDIDDLGVAPAGLVVASLVPGDDYDDIGFVNSRRMPKGRNEVLQGSEIVVLQGEESAPDLSVRVVLNSTNAVGLTTYTHRGDDGFLSLVTAAQGRSTNDQVCDNALKCSSGLGLMHPPCPAGEYCGCEGEICRCSRDDRFLDKVVNASRLSPSVTRLYNFEQCHIPILTCDKNDPLRIDPPGSECVCGDLGGLACPGATRDYCECKLPRRDLIGSVSSSAFPRHVASGVLRVGNKEDLVVSADSGLRFMRLSVVGMWEDTGFPILSDFPVRSEIIDVDADGLNDIVWIAAQGCNTGSCDVQSGRPVDDPNNRGCLGVLPRTESSPSLYTFKDDTCRTFMIEFAPESFCTGDFNGDSGIDVAVSAGTSNKIALYLGNGSGGFLSEPVLISLPEDQVGGMLDCKDINGDGLEEIAVVNGRDGTVNILWTQN